MEASLFVRHRLDFRGNRTVNSTIYKRSTVPARGRILHTFGVGLILPIRLPRVRGRILHTFGVGLILPIRLPRVRRRIGKEATDCLHTLCECHCCVRRAPNAQISFV